MAGRKSKYYSHVQPYLKEIKTMYMQGSSDVDIYKKLKIDKDTFYKYKRDFSEFSDCFKYSDIDMIQVATEGLLTRASGKKWTEVTKGFNTDVEGNKSPIYKEVTKWLPPDKAACEFILKKKAPKEWGDIELFDDDEDEDFYELDNIKLVPHFEKWFYDEYHKPKYLYHILKGGRGSGKSTSVARQLIKDILQFPINILVVRKIHSTILESCYEELKQAMNDLGVEDEFKCVAGNKFYIRRKKTGQKFIFRGGVEPAKIKSIKTSKFPIGRLWVEELTEFKEWNDVKIIVDSVVRADLPKNLDYKIIFTYNPAKRKTNWCNDRYESKVNIPKNTYINHSTSFVNPFLSDEFMEDAEAVKLKNEIYYKWYYLGEPIGGGIVPFNNLEFREISNEEIVKFDNVIQGIDWGYSINPFHHTRCHLDLDKFILYIYGEINQLKLIDIRAGEKIIKLAWNDIPIIADNEDPKSIANIRTLGIRVAAAKKGPGSVEHGLEWLDSLTSIIIDPVRCPKTAKSFEIADYEVNKQGELLENLDRKNPIDPIDAVRYATERFHYNKRKF